MKILQTSNFPVTERLWKSHFGGTQGPIFFGYLVPIFQLSYEKEETSHDCLTFSSNKSVFVHTTLTCIEILKFVLLMRSVAHSNEIQTGFEAKKYGILNSINDSTLKKETNNIFKCMVRVFFLVKYCLDRFWRGWSHLKDNLKLYYIFFGRR